ncbi:MAG: hypothetical protein ACYTG6_11850 [Planctomycetota bacterium]
MTIRRSVLAAVLALGLLGVPPLLLDALAGPNARDAALLRSLETRRLSKVEFQDHSLQDVVKWLRIATGHNILVKQVPIAKAGIDVDDIRFTIQLQDVTAGQVLRLLLEPEGLAVQVKGNIVFVTTRQDALGRPITRLYGISHITYVKTDFIAPEINLRPSDFTPAEEYVPEEIVEDDPLTSGDAVADLVRELVSPEDWDNDGWSIRATDRYLVIRAPASVHAQVLRALDIIASLK